ncbi:MAG: MbcA/ParS/Xre antitoxin family protein [Gemmatimonadaceae bacterium]|jgi:hypothetical protein
MKTETAVQPSERAVLSKAVVRAAQRLALNQSQVADVLGISAASASRLFGEAYLLEPNRGKEWEMAVLLVRLFRSLDAILGHGDQAQKWLHGMNTALGQAPIDLIGHAEGLVRVVHYLDAYRGRV